MKYFFYILLLLIAPQAFGGPFDPPPTDQSVSLLGIIFGASIGDLYLGGQANPVLSDLMEKFNFIIVVVGTVVVSYVAILSTINTAHEGQAMGKKWSAVWIPMRSVAGMALMVPAPSTGYSMIQVTVMWIILQGIGAADSLWNIALNGLSSGVSATAGTSNTSGIQLKQNANSVVPMLLNAQMCMKGIYAAASAPWNVNANGGNGNWVSQNGQYVTNFAIADASGPTITGTAPNRVAQMKGWSYFGVNNNDPASMAVCGKIRVVGTVTENKDYSGDSSATSSTSSTGTPAYIPTNNDMMNQAQNIYYTKLATISSILNVFQGLAQGMVEQPTVTATGADTYVPGTYSAPGATSSATTAYNPPPPGYQAQAVNAYVGTLSALAIPQAGGAAISSTNFQGITGVTSGGTVGNAIANAGIAATNAVGGVLSGQGMTPITDNSAAIQNAIQQGQANGWISAGSFYFIFNRTLLSTLFASATANDMSDQNPPLPATGNPTIPSCQTSTCQNALANGQAIPDNATYLQQKVDQNVDINAIAQDLSDGYNYLQSETSNQQVSQNLNFNTPGVNSSGASAIFQALNTMSQDIINALTSLMNSVGDGDPLLAHAILGRDIMLICEGVFVGIIAVVFVAIAGVAAGFFIPVISWVAQSVASGLLGILAIITPIIGIMWIFGAMLAIYMPLIPYMIFTMGAVGWLMVVIEAVIAAPIVALGIIIPSGEELGKLESALGILANIFLRPMLMIFGFLLAARLYKAVITLIDFGLASVFQTIIVATLFSTVMIVFVYVFFILSVTNICFSLIYQIPDKILRWIGVSGEHTETGNLAEVKQQAQAAGGAVGGFLEEKTIAAGKAAGGAIKGAGSWSAGIVGKYGEKSALGRVGSAVGRGIGRLFGGKGGGGGAAP